MALLCGWASCSENGTANGKKGDQKNGLEVKTGAYYKFGQKYVIRMKNIAKRKKAAKAMKRLCANKHVGYGQTDRYSLYSECKRIGWDVDRIDEIRNCNGDCSETVICAINFGYGRAFIGSGFTTSTLYSATALAHKNSFKKIPISKLTKQSMFRLGDMPVDPGHHVIMVIGR